MYARARFLLVLGVATTVLWCGGTFAYAEESAPPSDVQEGVSVGGSVSLGEGGEYVGAVSPEVEAEFVNREPVVPAVLPEEVPPSAEHSKRGEMGNSADYILLSTSTYFTLDQPIEFTFVFDVPTAATLAPTTSASESVAHSIGVVIGDTIEHVFDASVEFVGDVIETVVEAVELMSETVIEAVMPGNSDDTPVAPAEDPVVQSGTIDEALEVAESVETHVGDYAPETTIEDGEGHGADVPATSSDEAVLASTTGEQEDVEVPLEGSTVATSTDTFISTPDVATTTTEDVVVVQEAPEVGDVEVPALEDSVRDTGALPADVPAATSTDDVLPSVLEPTPAGEDVPTPVLDELAQQALVATPDTLVLNGVSTTPHVARTDTAVTLTIPTQGLALGTHHLVFTFVRDGVTYTHETSFRRGGDIVRFYPVDDVRSALIVREPTGAVAVWFYENGIYERIAGEEQMDVSTSLTAHDNVLFWFAPGRGALVGYDMVTRSVFSSSLDDVEPLTVTTLHGEYEIDVKGNRLDFEVVPEAVPTP